MNPTPSQPERPELPEERILELISIIKHETQPVEGHGDPKAVIDAWRSLEEEVAKLATRTPAPEAAKCPVCGSLEVEADTPRTVYACGSSDYDQRPGTFIQKCTAPEAVAVMNLEIKDGEIVQAATPPVEADKDAEVEAFVKHTGAPNFKEAVDALIRTNAGHMEQVEKQFNKIKEQGRDLTTARTEIARLKEEFQKAKEWNRLTELEIANLRSLYEEQEKELNLAKQEALAIRHSVVSTVGGVDYEGNPTSVINYLQRLRILVAAESDLTTARATIAKLEEESANKEATIRAFGESRENLRATIAERDKRIETLVGALEAAPHVAPCLAGTPEYLRIKDYADRGGYACKCWKSALAHAAEGKEQA